MTIKSFSQALAFLEARGIAVEHLGRSEAYGFMVWRVGGIEMDKGAVIRYAEAKAARPAIVCLCGSTRFWRAFQKAGLDETLAGRIVLSIGAASGTDDEHFGNLPREQYEAVKTQLDELHLRKIDLADEVLILNVGGYIGESTARELAYARTQGKRIRFLEPEQAQ